MIYLLVAFSDSGIDNLVCRESAVVCMQDLVSADTVCTESLAADVFQKPSFHIGLDGVMYPDSVFVSHFSGMVCGLAQQVHVVIIEWSRDFIQLLYCVDIQHIIFNESRLRHRFGENTPKTIAKIAKKSVISQNICYDNKVKPTININ